MERRDFLRRLGLTTAAVAVGAKALAERKETTTTASGVPTMNHPEPTGETWIDKAAFDAEMDANDKAHNEWVEYVKEQDTGGSWGSIYKAEVEPKVWRVWNKRYGGVSPKDWIPIIKP